MERRGRGVEVIFPNERCVVCHEELSMGMGWGQLFSKEKNTRLCESCKHKLKFITGERCKICSRSFENGEYLFKKGDICFDCLRWEEEMEWQGMLEKNTSLFMYNDFLKETLATFKFRGDYAIAQVFGGFLQPVLETLEFDCLVPVPLSEERLYERGFNQAEALIKEAGFAPVQLLKRIHSEKQSKKSRYDRIHLSEVFLLNDESPGLPSPVNKIIILVDDIYTTGSTVRHAAKVLRKAGAKKVYSLTIARG